MLSCYAFGRSERKQDANGGKTTFACEQTERSPPMSDTADAANAEPASSGEPPPAVDVPVPLQVVLGQKAVPLEDILGMRPGSLVKLQESCDAPLGVYVGGVRAGYGRVVEHDDRLGLLLEAFEPHVLPGTGEG